LFDVLSTSEPIYSKWVDAMKKEILALKANNTWKVTDLALRKNGIS